MSFIILIFSQDSLIFTSHLTPHTSHLTPHTSHLTPHTSHLTPHTSHLTPHIIGFLKISIYLTNSMLCFISKKCILRWLWNYFL
ncbi:hypothetical protein T190115A13A_20004 [Tenacibaculum sp. 190524A02b]|uniref:Uncharacterized protein n=1 Tax=Tenacibaculum vairaonense TaxID=3137860 RepID=A0ABM9PM02_9FLAO